ncbi:hypothetical protein [Niabella soli]|uniref:Uncharacterized protein n=1 Tax=Niabella soli DSM 19437 TaxID=929713 RepID=W0F5V2_9BACT|nr:hypothetical protein [Niabella soli]AHF17183.1 hypothetical protein NIASO_03230 [Niabella soli DSM 19437]
MRKHGKIQYALGWCLLIVFTIAVTPKLYLHNALSHHKDQLFEHSGQKSIYKYEYSCGFINIETTAPFVDPEKKPSFLKRIIAATIPDPKPVALFFLYLTPAYLRGPPAYIS